MSEGYEFYLEQGTASLKSLINGFCLIANSPEDLNRLKFILRQYFKKEDCDLEEIKETLEYLRIRGTPEARGEGFEPLAESLLSEVGPVYDIYLDEKLKRDSQTP